ncbi:unnamed protein product [Absidia cylindrospora]
MKAIYDNILTTFTTAKSIASNISDYLKGLYNIFQHQFSHQTPDSNRRMLRTYDPSLLSKTPKTKLTHQTRKTINNSDDNDRQINVSKVTEFIQQPRIQFKNS